MSGGRIPSRVARALVSEREMALQLKRIQALEAAQGKRMQAVFARRAKNEATADFDLLPPNDQIEVPLTF